MYLANCIKTNICFNELIPKITIQGDRNANHLYQYFRIGLHEIPKQEHYYFYVVHLGNQEHIVSGITYILEKQ